MSYINKLEQIIVEWSKRPIEDEWLFASFQENVIEKMSPEDAYSQIGPTLDILIKQTDESTAFEVLQSVYLLARTSDTTEVPAKLSNCKEQLMEQFNCYDKHCRDAYKEFLTFYRLEGGR